jgi:hypothetical protein
MMRSTGCATAYVTRMGEPVSSPPEVVHIYEPAPADLVVSVDEQLAYHRRWLSSFGKGKSIG